MRHSVSIYAWVIVTALVGCVVLAGTPRTALLAQEGELIFSDSPRPLARAIRDLEDRHGWVVTYEDPDYAFAGEFREFQPDRDRTRTALGLRGGSFLFQYSSQDLEDRRGMLYDLVDTYHHFGLPGRFRVVQANNAARGEHVFHVVPAMSRDVNGIWQSRASRLDVPITLPARDRTNMQMLEEILRAVGVSAGTRGTRISIGTIPVNSLMTTLSQGGSSNETARDVLVRTLAATGRRDLSWQMLCGAETSGAGCAFNVHVVTHDRFAEDTPNPRWAPSTLVQ